MARPVKLDKKQAISLKLPPHILNWLDAQQESRAYLIEYALTHCFHISDDKQEKIK